MGVVRHSAPEAAWFVPMSGDKIFYEICIQVCGGGRNRYKVALHGSIVPQTDIVSVCYCH